MKKKTKKKYDNNNMFIVITALFFSQLSCVSTKCETLAQKNSLNSPNVSLIYSDLFDSICEKNTGFQTMSSPLLVNMRYSLESFTEKPISTEVSIGVIHHEILHLLLEALIAKDSKYLKNYASEDPMLVNHLYLFAL